MKKEILTRGKIYNDYKEKCFSAIVDMLFFDLAIVGTAILMHMLLREFTIFKNEWFFQR